MLQALLSILIVFLAGMSLLTAISPFPRPRLNRPNVVVIYTDDQEVTSLPNMPYLMSGPGGSWVQFTNAFANDAICTPSRATMLTGQYSHSHGIIQNGLGGQLDDTNTIATWLDDAGYDTALFGKYSNGYPWNKGADWIPSGWDEFDGNLSDTVLITETALGFLDGVEGPFFLNVNYRAPHYQVEPSPTHRDADVLIPPRPPNMPETDISDKPAWVPQPLRERDLLAIEARRTVSYRTLLDVDDGVEALMEALSRRGDLDNTLIIYISDHGFSFGSHNWERKHCPYDECHRVPLLVRYPGLSGNRVDSRHVSMVDMVPTIADYVGVTPGLPQDGRSILPLLKDPSYLWDDIVLLEKFYESLLEFAYFGVRTPGWKYIEYDTGERELYDLVTDPYELDNLAGQPAYAAREAELAAVLEDLLAGRRPLDEMPTPTPTSTPTATATMLPPPTTTPTVIPEPTVTPSPTRPPQQLIYQAFLPLSRR